MSRSISEARQIHAPFFKTILVVTLLSCTFLPAWSKEVIIAQTQLLDDDVVGIPLILFENETYFIVDTGADTSYLNNKYLDRLGAAVITATENSTFSNRVSLALFKAPGIVIGNHKFSQEFVGVHDLKMVQMITGRLYDGILGMEF